MVILMTRRRCGGIDACPGCFFVPAAYFVPENEEFCQQLCVLKIRHHHANYFNEELVTRCYSRLGG
jgi:hypothetical protein